MISAIQTTIDAAGRLVLPKAIRDAAGIAPGMKLHVAFREGRIEIEPAPLDVHVVDRGGFTIAEPTGPYEPLRHETVRDARQKLRERRKQP